MIEEINYAKFIDHKDEYNSLIKKYGDRVFLSGPRVSNSKYDWKHVLIKELLQQDNYSGLIVDPYVNDIYGLNLVGKLAWEMSLISKCTSYCMWLDNDTPRERILELGVYISSYNNCRYLIGIGPTTIDALDLKKRLYLMSNLKLIKDFRFVDTVQEMASLIINKEK